MQIIQIAGLLSVGIVVLVAGILPIYASILVNSQDFPSNNDKGEAQY